MSQDTRQDWKQKPREKWTSKAPHWSNDIDPQFSCPICAEPMMISGTSHLVARSALHPSIEFSMDFWICTDGECGGCYHGERVSGKMCDDEGKQVTPKVLGEVIVQVQHGAK